MSPIASFFSSQFIIVIFNDHSRHTEPAVRMGLQCLVEHRPLLRRHPQLWRCDSQEFRNTCKETKTSQPTLLCTFPPPQSKIIFPSRKSSRSLRAAQQWKRNNKRPAQSYCVDFQDWVAYWVGCSSSHSWICSYIMIFHVSTGSSASLNDQSNFSSATGSSVGSWYGERYSCANASAAFTLFLGSKTNISSKRSIAIKDQQETICGLRGNIPNGSAFRNLSFNGCLSRFGSDWTNLKV